MSIPDLLLAPTLLSMTVGANEPIESRLTKTQRSLDQLALQRRALLSGEMPRLIAAWEAQGADEARDTYRDALILLAGVEMTPDARDLTPDVVTLTRSSAVSGADALAEAVRIQVIARASRDGVSRLARSRIRISGMARRIGDEPPPSPRVLQRLLGASPALAASAVAVASQPAVAGDGGVNRRFSDALRQLAA
jgi:hypothetical protein